MQATPTWPRSRDFEVGGGVPATSIQALYSWLRGFLPQGSHASWPTQEGFYIVVDREDLGCSEGGKTKHRDQCCMVIVLALP